MGEPRGLSHILNPSGPPPSIPSGEVRQYRVNRRTFEAYEENDRLYHAVHRGIYPYPTDERERNRYDMIHHLIHALNLGHLGESREVNGQTSTSALAMPIVDSQTPPYSILDLGCGSGIWACDIAERFTDAVVTGADIVGGQPAGGSNLVWMTPDSKRPFDFEAPDWPLQRNSFDLIHASNLCGSVSSWPVFLEKVKRFLRPKTGQIELVEIDYAPRCVGGIRPPDPIQQWWDYMQHATQAKPIACPDAKRLLQAAGFVDIKEELCTLPFTDRGVPSSRERNSGRWYKNLLTDANDSFSPVSMINGLSMGPLTRNLGWTRAQVDHLVADVTSCVLKNETKMYNVLHIWTARRPGSDENL